MSLWVTLRFLAIESLDSLGRFLCSKVRTSSSPGMATLLFEEEAVTFAGLLDEEL